MATSGTATSSVQPETNVIETLQSLIVAFVLAMTFRGFVTEGFVIPTGSMAPTLLGQHALVHSQQTGTTFQTGLDQFDPRRYDMIQRAADPMLGPGYPGSGVPKVERPRGMGDRILVLKALYPFSEPKRFDVVVFKNPTDPLGDAANYIKRLVGLPNEQVWMADGDVFARPLDGETFHVQRKPEHVQRAVWQMVYHSDHAPRFPHRLDRRYDGPPWVGDVQVWDTSTGSYSSNTAEHTILEWDNNRRAINDWTPYNMLAGTPPLWPVSDVRVSAGIEAPQPGLKTMLELEVRSHLLQFIIDSSAGHDRATATLRMRPLQSDNAPESWVQRTTTLSLPAPGKVFNVEFWHVDQAMQLFINGKRVMDALEYDWSPFERLQNASGDLHTTDVDALIARPPLQPQLRWHFEGSPVTLHRVQLDRDLHYRLDELRRRQGENQPLLSGPAFASHPERNAGILRADQFMMAGDNSQSSLDSRLWGSPHELIATQIDDAPFVVNRRLLIGKAWVVYFPAPHSITEGGVSIVPDFGRLRFIR